MEVPGKGRALLKDGLQESYVKAWTCQDAPAEELVNQILVRCDQLLSIGIIDWIVVMLGQKNEAVCVRLLDAWFLLLFQQEAAHLS